MACDSRSQFAASCLRYQHQRQRHLGRHQQPAQPLLRRGGPDALRAEKAGDILPEHLHGGSEPERQCGCEHQTDRESADSPR